MSTFVTGFKNNKLLTLVEADRYCENRISLIGMLSAKDGPTLTK